MNDRDVIETAKDIVGRGNVHTYKSQLRGKIYGDVYYIGWSSGPGIEIMEIMKPLLHKRRREKIEEILENWNRRYKRGQHIEKESKT